MSEDPRAAHREAVTNLRAAVTEYVDTKQAHDDAKTHIEAAIAAALLEGVAPAEVYRLASPAVTERTARKMARARGVDPAKPWSAGGPKARGEGVE